jgi:para-aminobenzoate synthetase component 1
MDSNFLITLNNSHPEGFEDSYYELSERSRSDQGNSVALITYDQERSFYPIGSKRHFDISELKTGKENSPITFSTRTNKAEYIKRVNALKHHIHIGDIYEINFCVEFEALDVDLDPYSVFVKLNQLAYAPYAALAKLDDIYIISASPELFLKRSKDTLITKPIKGTAKRSDDRHEDENLKQQLHLSLKERTENVMIVDVSRNDLSMLAQRATVTVPKLYHIESYKTVHQMVSTVQCKLKNEVNFNEIMNATFPMPSMTGAPKLRAMQLSDEYEQFKRKEYSGALGYIDQNGDFTLSVLIRTLVYNSRTKRLSFGVGSAITHLCDSEKEYEECLLKAKALLAAVNGTIQ